VEPIGGVLTDERRVIVLSNLTNILTFVVRMEDGSLLWSFMLTVYVSTVRQSESPDLFICMNT
jgi:hypothetical protein